MGTQIRSRMGATPILAQQVRPDEPNRSHLGREVREREKRNKNGSSRQETEQKEEEEKARYSP